MKIKELKDDMHNVSVVVKVINVSPPKTVRTKKGETTIREATVEDDSGRIKLTLWGKQNIKPGATVKIENAWTTVYKGEIKLNVSSKSKISEVRGSTEPSYTKPSKGYHKPYSKRKSYVDEEENEEE